MPNAIVGQSGGPTSVINSSLAGVMQACQMRGAEQVYGMLHGIQGLLEEKVCNLSERMKSFIVWVKRMVSNMGSAALTRA